MKFRLLIFGIFIFALALVIAPGAAAQQNMDGIVSIDSVSGLRNDQVAIEVRLDYNNLDLSGFLIPIQYPESQLQIDSVSFSGTFMTTDFVGAVDTVGRENVVRISYLPSNLLADPVSKMISPNGKLATIYFHILPDAAPGMIVIDSTNDPEFIGGYRSDGYVPHMSDPSGTTVLYPGFDGGGIYVMVPTAIEDDFDLLPKAFNLSQNYPNPFNPSTIIDFNLPHADFVTLDVYNVLGQKVTTLHEGRLSAGYHSVEFRADNQPSGLFFYRLTYSDGAITKKMLLVK